MEETVIPSFTKCKTHAINPYLSATLTVLNVILIISVSLHVFNSGYKLGYINAKKETP